MHHATLFYNKAFYRNPFYNNALHNIAINSIALYNNQVHYKEIAGKFQAAQRNVSPRMQAPRRKVTGGLSIKNLRRQFASKKGEMLWDTQRLGTEKLLSHLFEVTCIVLYGCRYVIGTSLQLGSNSFPTVGKQSYTSY